MTDCKSKANIFTAIPNIMKKRGQQSKLAALKKLVPCEVCGMSSSGRHYGAFSCEGCRNFFKRSLTAHQFYSCRHSPDTESANCKLCRFRACLRAGMSMNAVKVGRPTADERAAVSAYLTRLESEQRLLVQPITRKRQRRKSVMTRSLGSDALMKEFEQRLHDGVQNFNYNKQDVTEELNFDWQTEPHTMWKTLCQRFEAKVVAAADLMRTLPGFPKMNVQDRVSLFSGAVLPIAAAKCCFLTIKRFQGPVNVHQLTYDSLFSFLSINANSWQLVLHTFGQPMQRLENLFYRIASMLMELNLNEEEFAMIYAKVFFNGEEWRVEDKSRYETIANVYDTIIQTVSVRFRGSSNAFDLTALVAAFKQVTEIIVSIDAVVQQQQPTSKQGAMASDCLFFNEVILANISRSSLPFEPPQHQHQQQFENQIEEPIVDVVCQSSCSVNDYTYGQQLQQLSF